MAKEFSSVSAALTADTSSKNSFMSPLYCLLLLSALLSTATFGAEAPPRPLDPLLQAAAPISADFKGPIEVKFTWRSSENAKFTDEFNKAMSDNGFTFSLAVSSWIGKPDLTIVLTFVRNSGYDKDKLSVLMQHVRVAAGPSAEFIAWSIAQVQPAR